MIYGTTCRQCGRELGFIPDGPWEPCPADSDGDHWPNMDDITGARVSPPRANGLVEVYLVAASGPPGGVPLTPGTAAPTMWSYQWSVPVGMSSSHQFPIGCELEHVTEIHVTAH